jgi:hypothetical protein
MHKRKQMQETRKHQTGKQKISKRAKPKALTVPEMQQMSPKTRRHVRM